MMGNEWINMQTANSKWQMAVGTWTTWVAVARWNIILGVHVRPAVYKWWSVHLTYIRRL